MACVHDHRNGTHVRGPVRHLLPDVRGFSTSIEEHRLIAKNDYAKRNSFRYLIYYFATLANPAPGRHRPLIPTNHLRMPLANFLSPTTLVLKSRD